MPPDNAEPPPAPAEAAAGPAAARASVQPARDGRAYLGLALLGWGLSVLIGVTPHEDPWVGAGLAAFGFALLATARHLPEFRTAPAWLFGGLGLAIVTVVAGFGALFHATLDLPKVLMILLGAGVAASAPFLRRRITVGRRGRTVPVASIVVAALAVLGAPLAVWALQAATKGLTGTTPVEAFVHVGLLLPLGLFLYAIGLHPAIEGQTITYATPNGPLAVQVGAACSGLQAMALFAGVLALFLWIEKPGGRRLAAWTAIGIGGVYVANLMRLGVLTLVGYQWGADALVRVHAQAGWVFFVAWALLFARLAKTPRTVAA